MVVSLLAVYTNTILYNILPSLTHCSARESDQSFEEQSDQSFEPATDDILAYEMNNRDLKDELGWKFPQASLVQMLLWATYSERRKGIEECIEKAHTLLEEYPSLKAPRWGPIHACNNCQVCDSLIVHAFEPIPQMKMEFADEDGEELD